MRTRNRWMAGVLLGAVLAVGTARGQEPLFTVRGQDATGYALPHPVLPIPTGSTRMEEGWFFYGGYALYRQNVTLGNQQVAVRGFLDFDGSISGIPGTFFGSGVEALNTDQVTGPGSYQPGFIIGGGYRFENGIAVSVNWLHLTTKSYSAVATSVAPTFNAGFDLADTFLFSPVSNFPPEFAGPTFGDADPFLGNVIGDINENEIAFGLWNGADIMTLEYTQRFEMADVTVRIPIFEAGDPGCGDLTWRTYGLVGPQFVWFWENFEWRTTDLSISGLGSPEFVGLYSNTVSNRIYGVKCGCGTECYLGHGFSFSCDLEGSINIDIVKERVKYERGDRNLGPERKRSITDYEVVPGVRGTFNLWWYPYEGIIMKAGYDLMAFFNTVHSPQPIDFNYSSVSPEFQKTYRFLDGFQVGIAFTF